MAQIPDLEVKIVPRSVDLGIRIAILATAFGSLCMAALLLGAVVALWRWALSF